LEELGVLSRIHPGLRCDGWLLRKAATLRQVLPQWYESSWQPELSEEDHDALHGLTVPADNAPHLYLALLTYRLVVAELDTLITRINLGRSDGDLLHEIADLKGQLATLQTHDVRPSDVVHLLEPFSGPAILVAWVATDSTGVRDHLRRYWQTYRHVKPALKGDDLKAMGLRPGPIYREILGAVRDAHLNGEISTSDQERALAWTLISRTS
jgi:tRNA nucleotidyltransferase (CCA-adding enzyme)